MQHRTKKKRTQLQSVTFGLSISLLIVLAAFSFSAEREYVEERIYSKKGQLEKKVTRKKETCRLDSQAVFIQDEKKGETGTYLALAVLAVTVISGCSYRWPNS